MEIRRAIEGDLGPVLSLEEANFSLPWSREGFLYELQCRDADFLCAVEEERILGFAIAHLVGDETELYNICVDERERGRGIGGELIDCCIRLSEKRGAKRMLLEVRQSNKTARGLYAAKGFQVLGVRKNYYDEPKEDAVMMEREI